MSRIEIEIVVEGDGNRYPLRLLYYRCIPLRCQYSQYSHLKRNPSTQGDQYLDIH